MKKLSNIKIAGLSLPLYTALVIILAVVIAMGKTTAQHGWNYFHVGRFRTSFLLPW